MKHRVLESGVPESAGNAVARDFITDADTAAYRRHIFEQGACAMKMSLMSMMLCLLLTAPSAGAQQLNRPGRIEPARPATGATQSPGNKLAPPVSTQRDAVSSDPAQRSQAPKISDKGPAVDAERPAQPASATPRPSAPLRVTDARGRLVSGAVPVGQNQVMDPKTGRVYSTVPDGDGQRIVEPRPKP
jgi:hypothetical protein